MSVPAASESPIQGQEAPRRKIAMLTAHDATMAALLERAGVDIAAGGRLARHGGAGI